MELSVTEWGHGAHSGVSLPAPEGLDAASLPKGGAQQDPSYLFSCWEHFPVQGLSTPNLFLIASILRTSTII